MIEQFSPGYLQAIENMAWSIHALTEETLEPMFQEFPFLTDMDMDEADEFIDNNMPQEHTDRWLMLDMIIRTISQTYHKPVSEVETAVNAQLALQEIQRMSNF